MANGISFRLEHHDENHIALRAQTVSETFDLQFSFSTPIDVPTSAIAIAAASLCGQAFDSITFEFAVEDRVIAIVQDFTRASVQALRIQTRPPRIRSGTLLSFSGGFDSLAALAVMPADTHLVSIDFGGHFVRESEFFSRFDPLIVSTNVRQTPLVHNSWAFMYLGAALSGDHFNAKYHSFGSILASSISNPPLPGSFSLVRASGMIGADYVRGITEVGTVGIILKTFPLELRDSLASLAGPNDQKRIRKSLLSYAIDRMAKSEDVVDPQVLTELNPIKFGDHFADDFVTSYLLANSSVGLSARHFSNVPIETQHALSAMRLDFMHRYNPDFYEHFPAELLPDLFRRFATLGIHPYLSRDWDEYSNLRDLLVELHPALAR